MTPQQLAQVIVWTVIALNGCLLVWNGVLLRRTRKLNEGVGKLLAETDEALSRVRALYQQLITQQQNMLNVVARLRALVQELRQSGQTEVPLQRMIDAFAALNDDGVTQRQH